MSRYLVLLLTCFAVFFSVPGHASEPREDALYEWVQVDVGDVRPPPRDYACFVSGPNGDGVFMLGGRARNPESGSMTVHLRDFWRWDGESWELLDEGEDGPAECFGGNAIFDEKRNRLVVIAPNLDSEEMEHWEWDGSAWSMRDIPVPLRDAHLVVYDPVKERLLLFGGHGRLEDVMQKTEECRDDGQSGSFGDEGIHGCWGDLWEYVDGEWRQISTTCDRPAPLCTWTGDAYFDVERGVMRVIPMADSRKTSIFERTEEGWINNRGWVSVADSEFNNVIVGVRGVYNPATQEYLSYTVIGETFGEQPPELFAFSDRWYSVVTAGSKPKAEFLPALAYLPNSDEILLFGGRWRPIAHGGTDTSSNLSNDLWVLRQIDMNNETGGCFNCTSVGESSQTLWLWSILAMIFVIARRFFSNGAFTLRSRLEE